ncbi:MAG: enoyl-CoA hydratase-related protein [Sphingomicrobium sp.]
MTEQVRIEQADGVLSILLDRPDRRNAITVAMYAALADAISSAAGDESVRLITLRGAGVDFTAGNDLSDFLATPPGSGSEKEAPVWRLLRALAVNDVPILAAVQGNAVGIGTTMLFHCDLVIAEEGCRFLMPFVNLGLVPEAASSLLMPKLSGRRAAARHLLLGEPFGASEALALGIASHVAPAGGLATMFEQIRTSLLAKPAQALRLTQKLLRTSDRDEVVERMSLENGHFGERLASDEVKQAIAAFFRAR